MKLFKILLFIIFFANQGYPERVYLLYTANINATMENCNCGSDPLGGIDRIKTFVDQFRYEKENVLFIDGGNFFNSYIYDELNNSMIEIMSLMNYNIISPGMHLFINSKMFFKKYKQNFKQIAICSNSNLKLNKFKKLEIESIKIRIYGYISQENFKYTSMPEWLELDNRFNFETGDSGELIVLIFNGYLSAAEKFIDDHNNIDLILLSHDQQEGKWKKGNTTIIGGGHDAESVAVIEINKSENFDIKLEYKKMEKSIPPNVLVTSIVKEFKHKTVLKN